MILNETFRVTIVFYVNLCIKFMETNSRTMLGDDWFQECVFESMSLNKVPVSFVEVNGWNFKVKLHFKTIRDLSFQIEHIISCPSPHK